MLFETEEQFIFEKSFLQSILLDLKALSSQVIINESLLHFTLYLLALDHFGSSQVIDCNSLISRTFTYIFSCSFFFFFFFFLLKIIIHLSIFILNIIKLVEQSFLIHALEFSIFISGCLSGSFLMKLLRLKLFYLQMMMLICDMMRSSSASEYGESIETEWLASLAVSMLWTSTTNLDGSTTPTIAVNFQWFSLVSLT